MTTIIHPDAYTLAADDLLAVMVNNEHEYHRIRFECHLLPGLMPEGYHRQICEAVYKLRDSGEPVHDTTLLQLAPSVPLAWLLERVALYDDTRIGDVVRKNVEIVTNEGLHRGTLRMLTIAQAQLQEQGAGKRQKIVSRLVSMLSSIGSGDKIENVHVRDHARHNRLLDAASDDGVQTGIPFLDRITHGYERSHIWWIGGAYKGRKTTLALNMALGAALHGLMDNSTGSVNPAILSGEMTQGRVQHQLESMLAVAYIKRTGWYGKSFENHNGQFIGFDAITPALVKSINRQFGQLPDNQRRDAFCRALGDLRGHALFWAQHVYERLNLRIYDSSDRHGGLSSYEAVDMVISMDIASYGGNLFFLDYLQLFNAPGSGIFEEVKFMSRQFQHKAKQKNVTIFVLAQLNEEAIKTSESYSPGVKGGGDPAQTADYFIRTRYKDSTHVEDDTQLSVQMKLSRHGPAGKSVFEVLNIHPASGLILDQDWIDKMPI